MGMVNVQVKKYNEGMTGDEMIRAPLKVKRALEMLATEKKLKDEVKALRSEALEILAEFHFSVGARDFSVPGVGKCTAYLGQSSRFDKTAMALYLVDHGVNSDLVQQAMSHATVSKPNSNLTVRFTPE